MLEIKNVSKRYGKIVALSQVSFTVNDGEFVFLTGHSGAGKTTLLRLLLRQILPDTGEILLDGVDIVKLKQK
ncbi:MAG: ATP-binding cassette domain-containing protein, partial [Patescibacteria group bacterium]|nr:ATP-binding cassette domain-containing protein [Patescibacteria group bacterium]